MAIISRPNHNAGRIIAKIMLPSKVFFASELVFLQSVSMGKMKASRNISSGQFRTQVTSFIEIISQCDLKLVHFFDQWLVPIKRHSSSTITDKNVILISFKAVPWNQDSVKVPPQ